MADWAEDVCLQSDCWLIDWVGEKRKEREKKNRWSGEKEQVQLKEKQEEDRKKAGWEEEKQEK